MPCSRCESLPDVLDAPGLLHIWLPLGHSRGKVAAYLRESRRTFVDGADGALTIEMGPQRVADVLLPLAGLLSQVESDDTRCLFKPGGEPITSADVPRVQSLRQFLQLSQSGWLVEMLRDERLTSHFQPIVRVESPARPFGHELLVRGKGTDGTMVSPGHLFGVARDCGMLFQLDLAARRSAIRAVVEQNPSGHIFLNFSPTAIYDPSNCLRSTISAIDEAGIAHERVVFEVIEADKTVDVFHLRGILNYYRNAGFKVALDDIGSGYSSLNLLHQLHPDFLKLDIELVRDVDTDPYKALIAEKILEIAQRLSIQTIAEGVEREEEFAWVRTRGATFAQGYLFGRPAATPVRGIPTPMG